MTMERTHNLSCPKCGNNQDIPIWESINVKLNPELRDKLFKGEINIFACSKCSESTILNIPLLYHDMDNHFCVQYYPSGQLDDDTFFENFTKNGYLHYDEKTAAWINETNSLYIVQPHIVFSMLELIFYVIFREGILRNNKD